MLTADQQMVALTSSPHEAEIAPFHHFTCGVWTIRKMICDELSVKIYVSFTKRLYPNEKGFEILCQWI